MAKGDCASCRTPRCPSRPRATGVSGVDSDTRPAHAADAAAVLVVDRAVKVGIKLSFALAERVTWIPGDVGSSRERDGLRLGAAWRDGQICPHSLRIVAFFFVVQLADGPNGAPQGSAGLALILAGAAGNIVDSVFYGRCSASSWQPGTGRGTRVGRLCTLVPRQRRRHAASRSNGRPGGRSRDGSAQGLSAIFVADVASLGWPGSILKQKSWLAQAPPPSPHVSESAQ